MKQKLKSTQRGRGEGKWQGKKIGWAREELKREKEIERLKARVQELEEQLAETQKAWRSDRREVEMFQRDKRAREDWERNKDKRGLIEHDSENPGGRA